MNRLLVTLVALIPLIIISRAGAETKAIAEWTFDTPGDPMGWTVGSEVEGLAVRDGSFTGKTVARDPLVHGPMIDIPAKPNQYVEIRMKSSADGNGELYWANTTEPPYEGFRPEQVYQIKFKAGDFRVYRIFPFWQQEKKIIRLRLDPPENAEFAIDYIKVLEITGLGKKRPFFNFSMSGHGWVSLGSAKPLSSGSLDVGWSDEVVQLVSPGIDVDAAEYPWLSVGATSTGVDHVILQWVNDSLPGVRSYTLPLKPDGHWHTYNIPTETIPDWGGRIKMLAVQVPPTGGSIFALSSYGATRRPMGAAEIELKNLRLREAISRTGRPAAIEATLTNKGGEPAKIVKATLRIPSSPVGGAVTDKTDRRIDELKPGESQVLTWTVDARGEGDFEASIAVAATNATETSSHNDSALVSRPSRPTRHPTSLSRSRSGASSRSGCITSPAGRTTPSGACSMTTPRGVRSSATTARAIRK